MDDLDKNTSVALEFRLRLFENDFWTLFYWVKDFSIAIEFLSLDAITYLINPLEEVKWNNQLKIGDLEIAITAGRTS